MIIPSPPPESPASEEETAPEGMSPDSMVYRSSPQSPGGLVQDTAADVTLDDRTGPEPMLHYHAIFDPTVAPWKRNNARDRITPSGALVVADPSPIPVSLGSPPDSPGRNLWYGAITVELSPGAPAPLPSIAPNMRIRSVESTPALPDLRFTVDSAGNFSVAADFEGRARLLLLVDAPTSYFSGEIPEGIRTRDAWKTAPAGEPRVPAPVLEAAQRLWSELGVGPDQAFNITLVRLVEWFRSFTPGPPPPVEGTLLESLVRGQRGVCRHRAHAFVIIAQSLGIPARHVANEAHAFVEVHVPGAGAGWRRIDLGGGADGLTIHGGDHLPRHLPGEDPFPRPRSYVAGATTLPQPEGSPGLLTGLPPVFEPITGLARPLAWSAFEPIAEIRPEQLATEIRILRAERSVLRGDSMEIVGIITSRDGAPMAGLPVWLQLSALDNPAGNVLQVGATHSDEEGRFSAQVEYPIQLSIGRYRLQARTPGDARRGGAISEE